MKIIVIFLCLAASCFAAAPVVTITDDSTCLVDGQNFGQPQDVIVNNPQLASAVGIAWKVYRAKVVADAASATVQAQADATKAQADLAALVAALKATDLSQLPPALAAAASIVLATDKDRQAADLAAQKAAIEAKIAALPK